MCIARIQQNHNCLYKMLYYSPHHQTKIDEKYTEETERKRGRHTVNRTMYSLTLDMREGNETKVKINI